MDRDEALKLLRGGPAGIEEWNRRRVVGEAIPIKAFDLSGADFRGVCLRGAYLRAVNLSSADLCGADLCGVQYNPFEGVTPETNIVYEDLWHVHSTSQFGGTDLEVANLRRAKLCGANLRWVELEVADLRDADLDGACLCEARLRGADLSRARLLGADFRGADLRGAIFSHANLRDADFSGARCQNTIFVAVALSLVKGLELVLHEGPSTIGTDTLILSKGKIPESFLRGCGLPDAWITNLPALIGALEPIQFYSCFISHSHEDEEFARRLHSRMVQAKLRVWYAPEEMKGGRKVLDQIEGAIHVYDRVLLVLSEDSMQSGWVETELRSTIRRQQREGRHILFPIRITSWESVRDWKCFDADSGKDLAKAVREYHTPDFSNWKEHDAFEAAFARLLADLKAEVATPTSSA